MQRFAIDNVPLLVYKWMYHTRYLQSEIRGLLLCYKWKLERIQVHFFVRQHLPVKAFRGSCLQMQDLCFKIYDFVSVTAVRRLQGKDRKKYRELAVSWTRSGVFVQDPYYRSGVDHTFGRLPLTSDWMWYLDRDENAHWSGVCMVIYLGYKGSANYQRCLVVHWAAGSVSWYPVENFVENTSVVITLLALPLNKMGRYLRQITIVGNSVTLLITTITVVSKS